jgi:hypothetical protein
MLEPTLGFEPRTCCLRNSCSTAELCRRDRDRNTPQLAPRPATGSLAPGHTPATEGEQTAPPLP